MKRTSTLIALGAITACTLWATAFPGVKIGLEYMAPFTLAGIRFVIAGLMQVPFCSESPLRLIRRAPRDVLLVSLFNTFILYALFFQGLQLMRGAQAAIVCGASPLVAGLLAHRLMPDDRMHRRKAFALMFGLAGVILIAVGTRPWAPVGRNEFLGMCILFGSTFTSAFGNVLVAKNRQGLPPITLNATQMMLGGLGLFGLGLMVEGRPNFDLPLQFYGVLVYLSFLSAAAFGLWFLLLQHEKVSILNGWKFLVPVLGALLSWILLPEESPDFISIGGMILVALGVILMQWQRRKDRRIERYQRE